ncbi:hypothetical protein HMPREF1548_02427 [Clostridium sp. KLE 1755]|nr:hypothetical protein HMPREF1548_02427 [Clostridium sp. KLE 1755]
MTENILYWLGFIFILFYKDTLFKSSVYTNIFLCDYCTMYVTIGL